MMQFLNKILFPAIGVAMVIFVAGAGIVWLFHVIHSISRAADALERIADVLELERALDEEEDEEKGGAV